jgi:NAD(P)-dependent dehydrogenase (short-subunit alcohol dehydrogenase family)
MAVLEKKRKRVVLITGGTSGIGFASAERFLRDGCCVMLAGRSRERGQQAVARLSQALSQQAAAPAFVPADVRRVEECDRLVEECLRAFGQLDVLVNSAGAYLEGAIEDMTEAQFDALLAVNLKGTYFMCRAAMPHLKRTKGNIVNVSSDAGVHGNYFCSAYCASKGGVTLLTRALALETARFGVRVNAIAPGDILTPMTEQQLAAAPDRAQALSEMSGVYPLGHIGAPEDAAAGIFYLASEEARFVTGTILSIDGGLTA